MQATIVPALWYWFERVNYKQRRKLYKQIMSDNEDDCRDTLLSLQTTSREATGVGASTVVFGTSKRRSYGSVNEIRSVVGPSVHPQEDTQGIQTSMTQHVFF